MTGSVVVVTGPPGAGKTTVAGLVAERSERSVHIEADRFFRWIVGGYIEPWRPEAHPQNVVVMEIIADVANGYAKAGYLTILDGMLVPGWFLEPVTDAMRSAGVNVIIVVLRAPLDVCLARARSRPDRPLADGTAVERLWASFADLTGVEALVIDTGSADAASVAARIAEVVEPPASDGDE